MLLHLTAMQLDTPLPQEVLHQRCSWFFLIAMLAITLVVRILGMDLAGALLTGLMLGFAVVIVRDGMAELQKYNLVFGLLCSLNFFFDILPLLSMLGGRRKEEIRPVPRADDSGMPVYGGGSHKEQTYSVTVKTYPFFDKSQGIIYNAESLSMVLSPICMLVGAFLSFRAHDAMMRHMPNVFAEEDALAAGPGQIVRPGGEGRPLNGGNGPSAGRSSYGAQSTPQRQWQPFEGEGHRLDAA